MSDSVFLSSKMDKNSHCDMIQFPNSKRVGGGGQHKGYKRLHRVYQDERVYWNDQFIVRNTDKGHGQESDGQTRRKSGKGL